MIELFSGDHMSDGLMSPDTLGIVGGRPLEKVELLKPKLSIKKEDYGIIIKIENNELDTVELYGKRSSEEHFTLLSRISSGSHYIDSRSNLFNAPELREYMAYYIQNDRQVGKPSDVTLIIRK